MSRRLILQKMMPAFTKRGVPHSVLLAAWPENIKRMMTTIEIPKREEVVIHDKTRQLKAIEGFEKILREDIRSNERLIIMSAREYDHLPNQLALSLAAHAFENNREFFWHSIYGGYHDDLREDRAVADDNLKKCSLLILSNLADNSTGIKVEKARDLLTRYSAMNRIVVTAGINPLEYAKNVLRMRADALIWF